MLSINLLPVQEKKMIGFEEARRVVRFLAILFAAGFFIGASLLTPSYLPLVFERRELERSLVLEEEASQRIGASETKNLVRLVNLSLHSVRNFSGASHKASSILEGLFGGLSRAIVITSAAIKKNGDVLISGEADTRRDLLDFEQKLRESGRFQEVAVRLSDIVKGTDINFSIQGKLKQEYSF